MSRLTPKSARFWPLFLAVLVADLGSKAAAGRHLLPPGTPRRILGDFVRLTLTHNDGGALGIPTGRLGFLLLIVVSFLLVVGLGLYYRHLPPDTTTPAMGLGLLVGGAVGNLWSRIAVEQGVVDFIDIGVGTLRFWTFNLADTGITLGAAVLGWWFWRAEGGESPVTGTNGGLGARREGIEPREGDTHG